MSIIDDLEAQFILDAARPGQTKIEQHSTRCTRDMVLLAGAAIRSGDREIVAGTLEGMAVGISLLTVCTLQESGQHKVIEKISNAVRDLHTVIALGQAAGKRP